MDYIARITREVAALSPAGQAEVLEFIMLLKAYLTSAASLLKLSVLCPVTQVPPVWRD